MDPTSPIFDKIRIKSRGARKQQLEISTKTLCDHPNCQKPGKFRAPMGRLREGQYFSFCIDHVREYNATYNYFNGMTDDAVSHWMKDDVSGHRPTWAMGVNRDGKEFKENPKDFTDPAAMLNARRPRRAKPESTQPVYGVAARKALQTLNLDESANAESIKARYKDLVKRLHPDANGGDRSCEDKLREIIRAYKYLRSVKLA